MSDLRREIIKNVIDAFYEVCLPEGATVNPPSDTKYPAWFRTVMPQFPTPIRLDDDCLPAVSFEYGGSRLVEGAFTNEEVNIFSIYLFPVVTTIDGLGDGSAGTGVDKHTNKTIGDDLMDAASAVEETIRLIAQDLNAYQICYEDDYVSGVVVGQAEAGRDRNTGYIFMEVRIDFRVHYQIPLETDLI